jgi:hypothetical protein
MLLLVDIMLLGLDCLLSLEARGKDNDWGPPELVGNGAAEEQVPASETAGLDLNTTTNNNNNNNNNRTQNAQFPKHGILKDHRPQPQQHLTVRTIGGCDETALQHAAILGDPSEQKQG